MNFELSEEQRALVDTVEKFARDAAASRAKADTPEASRKAASAQWRQMVDLGLNGLVIAEDDGGIGMTAVEVALVCEALGRSVAQEPFISAAVVAPKLVELSSDASIRERCLHAIGDGSMRMTLASDESIYDFDLDRTALRMEERDGRLLAFGTKELVVDGLAATHFAVTARTIRHGFNVFVCAADQAGVTVAPLRTLDGSWFARVHFDGAEVSGPLFDAHAGLESVEAALDYGLVGLCGEAVGLMDRVLALTASYLQTRQQFGKPIGTFQALQHRFADMVVAAEQSRSATLMAVAALSGSDPRVRRQDVSAAKALVGRNGRAVTEAAIQLHGGIGITDEYELSRYVRRMIEIGKTWGDTEHHEAAFGLLTG